MSLALIESHIIKGMADELELDMKWDRFAKTTLQQERRFKPALREVFREQRIAVLRQIDNNLPQEQRTMKAPSDIYEPWLLNPDEWQTTLEIAAKPFIEDSMVEGAAVAIGDINAALGVAIGIDFDVKDPRVQRIVTEKLRKFSFEVNQETNRLLRDQFVEAIQGGESIPKIRKRVEKVFGFNSRVRADRIARTEVIGAHNAGVMEGMVASGVVETKKWLATRDARTRQHHRDIDGEVVKVDKKFSNGLMFPGDWRGALDEFINCRCTMVVGEFII